MSSEQILMLNTLSHEEIQEKQIVKISKKLDLLESEVNLIDVQVCELLKQREEYLEQKTSLINVLRSILIIAQDPDELEIELRDEEEFDDEGEEEHDDDGEDKQHENKIAVKCEYLENTNQQNILNDMDDDNIHDDIKKQDTMNAFSQNTQNAFTKDIQNEIPKVEGLIFSKRKRQKRSTLDFENYQRFKESTQSYLKTFAGTSISYPRKLKQDSLYYASLYGMKLVARDIGVSYTALKSWKKKQLLNIL